MTASQPLFCVSRSSHSRRVSKFQPDAVVCAIQMLVLRTTVVTWLLADKSRPARLLRDVCLLLRRLVRPKLDVAVLTEAAPLDQPALFPHQVLDGYLAVAKDVEVVADDVPIAAAGTGDERRAGVVALFGDVVVGAVAAGDAGEGELVVGGL